MSTLFKFTNPMEYRLSIVAGDNGWWSHLADIAHTFATDVMFTHGKSVQNMSVPVHTVHMESRYNKCLFDERQFNSNVLLFTRHF